MPLVPQALPAKHVSLASFSKVQPQPANSANLSSKAVLSVPAKQSANNVSTDSTSTQVPMTVNSADLPSKAVPTATTLQPVLIASKATTPPLAATHVNYVR